MAMGGSPLSQRAGLLALCLLRAYPATDSGKTVLTFEYPHRLRHITLTQCLDEIGYIYTYRATFGTGALRALEAPIGFIYGLFSTVTQSYLIKVLSPDLWLLPRHLHAI